MKNGILKRVLSAFVVVCLMMPAAVFAAGEPEVSLKV